MNTYLKNHPIRELYVCNAPIKKNSKGAVKILSAGFALADHEFICT